MKASKLLFILIILFVTLQNQGLSQNSSKKAKIAYKTTASSSKKSTPTKAPRIKFDKTSIDLGTIKEDAIIEKSFDFINDGDKDLVIINAKGSCGCTIPTPPALPIAPGGKGKILVKYTAKNKVGPQKPTITVVTNGVPSVVKLHLETWVDQIPGGVN